MRVFGNFPIQLCMTSMMMLLLWTVESLQGTLAMADGPMADESK